MKQTRLDTPMKFSSLFALVALFIFSCAPSSEPPVDRSNYANEVTNVVEELRKLLVEPEEAALKNLTAESLTYGHSNGVIEDQNEFIESLLTEKFKFTSVEQSEQTVSISGETAIVRHILKGTTQDLGKEPGTAHLKVLQVWQKTDNQWKLLARQAVRVPVEN